MVLCSFSFNSSGFGHRIKHFRRYILSEAEVTNVGALKFFAIDAKNSIMIINMKKRSRNIVQI